MRKSEAESLAVTDADLDRELVKRGGLYEFVRLAWEQVEPARFKDNWHIGAVVEHLEAVSHEKILRLLINMPPGTSKSLLVSVLWPAWEWGPEGRTTTKWIYGSYDVNLARRDALKMRRLIEGPWFQERWGDLLPEKAQRDSVPWTATEYQNRHGGWRFACSPKGKVTGRHADIQVADDPNKPQEALGRKAITRAELEQAWSWWTGVMATRFADLQTGRRVIMQQRVHDGDLSGHQLEDGGYEHLCLPMRYEPSRVITTSLGRKDPRTEEGELLNPERAPEAAVRRQERELGPVAAAAQLQQRPPSSGGHVFEAAWFAKRWTHIPAHCSWLQSWDMSFKGTDGTSWVVGQVWAWLGADIYLVHQIRRRMGFAETLEAVIELTRMYPDAIEKLVEAKANGPGIVDMLKSRVVGLTLVEPEGGKEARANAVQPVVKAGNVWLPAKCRWQGAHADEDCLAIYIAEMTGFPLALHDDQVDATTQALLRIARQLSGSDNFDHETDVLADFFGDE